jgi:hypothetical protein
MVCQNGLLTVLRMIAISASPEAAAVVSAGATVVMAVVGVEVQAPRAMTSTRIRARIEILFMIDFLLQNTGIPIDPLDNRLLIV